MYIADRSWRVRKVTVSTGIITKIAGNGATYTNTGFFFGDGGPATDATLYYPEGVAVDSAGKSPIYIFSIAVSYFALFNTPGNIYISDSRNNVIRKVTISTGIITTFAGTGTGSYSGDGGAATSATLNYPYSIAVDSAGTNLSLLLLISQYFKLTYIPNSSLDNLYIADFYNHRIRKVTVSTTTTSTPR